VSTPLVPVPEVGKGATYFTPQELQTAAFDARQEMIDMHYTVCGPGIGEESREDLGEFSLGALYDTLRVRAQKLNRAAAAAQTRTQAALDARGAAARGEGGRPAVIATELARQDAVRAFQTAHDALLEAEYRIADYQDLNGGSGDLTKAFIDERTRRRANNGGHSGIYVPEEYKDLRLSGITSRQGQDAGEAVIRISGRIVNTRKANISVPPIWISAEDRFGTQLKSQQAEAPRGQTSIAPGRSVAFNFTLKPMPAGTARTVVTFAPLHHAPRLKPDSYYCSADSDLTASPLPKR
jgi:hypothetical protein